MPPAEPHHGDGVRDEGEDAWASSKMGPGTIPMGTLIPIPIVSEAASMSGSKSRRAVVDAGRPGRADDAGSH